MKKRIESFLQKVEGLDLEKSHPVQVFSVDSYVGGVATNDRCTNATIDCSTSINTGGCTNYSVCGNTINYAECKLVPPPGGL